MQRNLFQYQSKRSDLSMPMFFFLWVMPDFPNR